MKNIQIIDGADNATFSIFQATDEEFAQIFPAGQDLQLSEDIHARLGDRATEILNALWERPILKRDVAGIQGTLFYDWAAKRHHLPPSMREVDWDDRAVNSAQRALFRADR